MPVLTQKQKTEFWRDGFIRIDNAVTAKQLQNMSEDLTRWVAESRRYTAAYGRMLDGRPRFDVEPGHSAERPALRRAASPTELSDGFLSVVTNSRATDAVEELLGPDLRFHHSKVNCKLPGAPTAVKWHQDFSFDPHSNDDLVTVILYIDRVTEENGPLEVVPGSHTGPLHSLWHDGRFTGATSDEVAAQCAAAAFACTGAAGCAYLMHTRLCHASGENRSPKPRALFIFNVGAADAVPLAPCAVPSTHQGLVIRGRDPGRIRSSRYELRCPEVPLGASFFVQQADG